MAASLDVLLITNLLRDTSGWSRWHLPERRSVLYLKIKAEEHNLLFVMLLCSCCPWNSVNSHSVLATLLLFFYTTKSKDVQAVQFGSSHKGAH